MLIRALFVGFVMAVSSNAAASHISDNSIRIGFTSVLSRSDIDTINHLTNYISVRIEREVWPVFTRSQAEMSRLLTSGSVDFAWVDPSTVVAMPEMRTVAAPSYQDGPYYFSLVVIRRDRKYEDIINLKGKPFSFGSTQSLSGSIAPTYELARQGYQAERFFRPLIYADDHIGVIKAVNDEFVEGGSISSIVFNQLSANARVLVENLKVLQQFGPYPSPPIVASPYTQDNIVDMVKNVLLSLHESEHGVDILKRLAIDHFQSVTPEHYKAIGQIESTLRNDSAR